MIFIASYWWLWVILTVLSTILTVLSFLVSLDSYSDNKAKVIFFVSLPLTLSGGIISTVSVILAIIQFIKS